MDKSSERNWLSWLIKVRIIALTFVLGIELLIVRLTRTLVPVRGFVTLILLWYTIAVFYAVLLELWDEAEFQSRLQILTDLIFTTLLVYVTGGIDTSFNFLYPLIIIVASILLPRWWAYLAAALSFIGFGAVLELSFFEVIRSYSITRPDLNALQLVIFINLFAYLLLAALSSNLVAKLRHADSQLKGTSDALLDLQALHGNVILSMRDGLITTDLQGRITLLNSAGEDLLGRNHQSVSGTLVSELFLDALPTVESSSVHGEIRTMTPLGACRTFGVTVSALQVPEKGTVGYIYTFADLTEIRRLEREVRMRDRLAAVGRLAAGIAHEIRNPLSSIAGSVQMLAAMAPLNEEQRLLVDIVNRESTRLNDIVSDFLLYSREKNYRPARHDLIVLLEDTLVLLENRPECRSKYRIIRHYSVEEAWAVIDSDRMKQVIWNICDNAFRAMPGGGELEVSVGSGDGSRWLMSFRDHGPGIDPQQREKIFEPFQSSFEGGTGLGLAIVYQIMQAHGGTVRVDSAAEPGARFVIELPQPPARAASRSALSPETVGAPRG